MISIRKNVLKNGFNDEVASEWNFGSSSEIIISLGDFNEHVGKCAEGFEGVHGRNIIEKKTCKKKVARVLR